MKKFLLGLLVGLVLAVMTGVVLVFSAIKLGDRTPPVAEGTTLLLKLDGGLPERAPVEIPFFSGKPSPTVTEMWAMLRRAAADSRIKAVVLQPTGVSGWSVLQQLRADLVKFRESGKPLIAILRFPTMGDYYLASAADKIYMPPEDYLYVKGMRAEVTYYKNTLDKVGAKVETVAAGRYKDALDPFTRTDMSPETREVLNSLLDGMYGDYVGTIAGARKKSSEELRRIIDSGPYTAQQAKSLGLVDALAYEDEATSELKKRIGQSDIKTIDHSDYLRSLGRRSRNKQIALVIAEGEIVRGELEESPFSDATVIAPEPFTKVLRQVGDNKDLSGVIVRIDSPGGDAFASDEILREMKLLSKKKPMVIAFSNLAASGGYYMAMTGDPIVAYPGTITGSIGVFYGKLNLRGLYDKLGMRKEAVQRGQNALIDSDYQPMTPESERKLREAIDATYDAFLSRVSEGRKRSKEQIKTLAEGRVWLGSQAKANGLVDELGGMDKAIDLIKQRAKIAAGDAVAIVPYPPRRSLVDTLMRRSAWARPAVSLDPALQKIIRQLHLPVWQHGGIMRLMPYSVEFR